MMRAVQYSRRGGPEVLEVREIDEPHAGVGQVRVAVRAAALNFFDVKVRQNPEIMPKQTLPSGQGLEFAGVIDEVGADSAGLSVGDQVLGWANFAAQADYVVVPATHVTAKPPAIDWATAAGIGLVGNTAMRTVAALGIRPGETVLVSAAAGGVGIIAAQLALRAGATVLGTASESNHAALRSLGIIPVAYGAGLVDRLRASAPQGIDAVLDNAGRQSVEAAIELGVSPSRINSIVYFEGAGQYGISTVGGGGKTAEGLSELAALFASTELILPIAATFPLSEVRSAYEFFESRHLLGKVVLTVP
jgi:NADPH:quinone reductase-like Zn-dependent oxidoreductase